MWEGKGGGGSSWKLERGVTVVSPVVIPFPVPSPLPGR